MIFLEIDELTPCLKDSLTGELINTEVIPVDRKSILEKYTKQSGWYTNWIELYDKAEIYALVIKGTYSFQGLIAIHNDISSQTAFIDWAVASPENNTFLTRYKKYIGVGGHLFAIAVQKSEDYGYDGAVSGFAANEDLMNYYIKAFNAEPICMLHPYQIFIDEKDSKKIKEVYTYDWSE